LNVIEPGVSAGDLVALLDLDVKRAQLGAIREDQL